MMKILELIGAAIAGGLVTLAISWFMLHGKIAALQTETKDLKEDFVSCHNEHLDCPESIKAACDAEIETVKNTSEEKIKALADVVKDLTVNTSSLSAELHSHLMLSQQVDAATEQRFARVEIQLTRIENKLDQLKGWKIVEG